MVGKIDTNGALFIKRGPAFEPAYCPFSPFSDRRAQCGDWCALFTEPEDDIYTIDDCGGMEGTLLTLCKVTHTFSALDDERRKG